MNKFLLVLAFGALLLAGCTTTQDTAAGSNSLAPAPPSTTGPSVTPTPTPTVTPTPTPTIVPETMYKMKTYIQGYLDKSNPDDRLNSLNNILYDGRKVTNADTPLAWAGTIADPVSGKAYVEEEKYYFYAFTSYDSSAKQVKAKNGQIGYETQFTPPIQFCTYETPSNITNSTGCPDQYETQKHRLKIKLLGNDWTIFGMQVQGSGVSALVKQVVVAKEFYFAEQMHIGTMVAAPNGFKVVLFDIQQPGPKAIFDIYNTDGNKVDTAILQETGTNEYNKYGLVIHLWSAFIGPSGSYAKVSIATDKLTLNDGATVDTDNTQWTVAIVGGGTAYGPSISKIQLKRIVIDDLSDNQKVPIINKPQIKNFEYLGLEVQPFDTVSMGTGSRNFPTSNSDTTTVDQSYVRLSSSSSTSINTVYYVTDGAGAGSSDRGTLFYQNTNGYFTPFFSSDAAYQAKGKISVNSGTNLTFSTPVTKYYSTGGICGTGTTITLATNTNKIGAWNLMNEGAVLTASSVKFNITECGTNGYAVVLPGNKLLSPTPATSRAIRYAADVNYAPYTYATGKMTRIRFNANGIQETAPDLLQWVIFIPELVWDDKKEEGAMVFDVGQASTAAPVFGSGTTTYIGYQYPYSKTVNTATSYEVGLITMRGSLVTKLTSTSAELKYAQVLRHALYQLTGFVG